LSSDASTDGQLVDSHFTPEELEAIQQGYKLLAEEEAKEETDDPGMAGHGDGTAKGNLSLMTRILIHIGHLFPVNDLFIHYVDALASGRAPTQSPVKDSEPSKSPEWSHRPGKEPCDPFKP